MIRKYVAVAALLLIALTACTRGQAQGSNATPEQVYGAAPGLSDVQNMLGSPDWWPTTPSFVVRPLDLPNLPESVKFAVAQRWVHVGTPETLSAIYYLYASTSDASTQVTNTQNQESQSTTSPKVGDQSVYYGYRLATNNAIYSMFAVVRVGVFVIRIEYDKDSGFAGVSAIAKIATKLVNRLKDVIGGKVHPSPLASADKKLLPPAGAFVTLVGSARLPIEAMVGSLQSSSPQALVDSFTQLGVKDFLFADYALDADLTMEVRAQLFSFSSEADATSWINSAIGASSLDASGQAVGYSAATGQYFGLFVASSYVGITMCLSTTPGEAASRACEAPFTSLVGAWQESLKAQ